MSSEETKKKYRTGCLVPLGIYFGILMVAFYITRPPLITKNFSEATTRKFFVAIVDDVDGVFEYGRRTLHTVRELDPQLPPPGYLLPENEITINVGDIHRAKVLEDHGDWQLIEYKYSNTYMATSIYRAYADRIEPVSYQMTSSVGDVMVGITVTVVVVMLYLLAVIINFFRNRRTRSVDVEPSD